MLFDKRQQRKEEDIVVIDTRIISAGLNRLTKLNILNLSIANKHTVTINNICKNVLILLINIGFKSIFLPKISPNM